MDSDLYEAQPCNLTKHAVFELAEDIANQLDFNPGDKLDIALKKLGGRLKVKDFWAAADEEIASIYVYDEGYFEIFLPTSSSKHRDRFTIAHEIGHYVLHYLYPRADGKTIPNSKIMFAQRYGSSRVEWEANWFAAAFLMPEEKFKQHYKECNGDLISIADYFGVSAKAAEIRAETMGLIIE